MSLSDLYLVTDKLQTISLDEVNQLQERLGFPLPEGYAEFMTTLGVGTYCDLLRVYEPQRILDEFEKARNRPDEPLGDTATPLIWTGHGFESWDEHYFWEEGRGVLTKEQVLKSVPFADSDVGDNIIFNPEIPDRLFVLPRHDNLIYWIPESFKNPLLWRSLEGTVHKTPEFERFESVCDRGCVGLFTALTTFHLPTLADLFTERWSGSEIHKIDLMERADDEDADQLIFLYMKAISGCVQLDKAVDDERAGIRIDFDVDTRGQVDTFVEYLKDMGFYETFRY